MLVKNHFISLSIPPVSKNRTGFSGKTLLSPLLEDSIRFGDNNIASSKAGIDPKDVKIESLAMAHLKNTFKIPVPRPATSTWPLALMGLLCGDREVDRYLKEYCNVKSADISIGIDKSCLPALTKQNRQNEILNSNEFEKFIRNIQNFAASEGKTVVDSIMLWRWMLKTDSTELIDKYLESCNQDKTAIKRLKEVPAPSEKHVTQEKQQRLSKEEINVLNSALKVLPTKILGQDEAIKSIIKAIKRARNGYDIDKDRPNRPVVRTLLLGPSGVGKTRTAELLAQLFNRPTVYITLTEYSSEMDAKKFTGAPPGFTGYDDPNFINKVNMAKEEAIKRGSHSPVIILDEVEKAHPQVQRTLMQMLDIGEIENGRMEKATFKGCDIIMTSNVAQKEILEAQRHGASDKDIEEMVDKALKKSFAPEFLGRIGKKIIYKSLSLENAGKILDMQITELAKAAKERDGYMLEVDKSLKKHILEKGYSIETGVRKIKDCVETYLHEPLTEEIEKLDLTDIPVENGIVKALWDGEKTFFNFTKASISKALAIPSDVKPLEINLSEQVK